MLSVYTRRYPPCIHSNIHLRRCGCPKWIQGTLADGRTVRLSARTCSWEKAEIRARAMEDVADPHKPNVKPRIEIAIAIQSFLEDEESRNLSKHTFEEEQVLFRNATKGLG